MLRAYTTFLMIVLKTRWLLPWVKAQPNSVTPYCHHDNRWLSAHHAPGLGWSPRSPPVTGMMATHCGRRLSGSVCPSSVCVPVCPHPHVFIKNALKTELRSTRRSLKAAWNKPRCGHLIVTHCWLLSWVCPVPRPPETPRPAVPPPRANELRRHLFGYAATHQPSGAADQEGGRYYCSSWMKGVRSRLRWTVSQWTHTLMSNGGIGRQRGSSRWQWLGNG